MKKLLIAFLLTLSLTLVFASCTGKDEKETDSTNEVTETESETESVTETDSTKDEDTESTSSENTSVTTEEPTISKEIIDFMSKVDDAMNKEESYIIEEHKTVKSSDFAYTVKEKRGFDGIYGYYYSYTDMLGEPVEYSIYSTGDIVIYKNGDEMLVAITSEAENEYFLSYVLDVISDEEEGENEEIIKNFKSAKLEEVNKDGVKYKFTLSTPTVQFLIDSEIIADESEYNTVEECYMTFEIDDKYRCIKTHTYIQASSTAIETTQTYTFGKDIELPKEKFDGCKVCEFEDIFGISTPECGINYGLDYKKDSAVISYSNYKKAITQWTLITYFPDVYDGMNLTMYGTFESFDETQYISTGATEEEALPWDLAFADNVTKPEDGVLMEIKGVVRAVTTEDSDAASYVVEVSSYKKIEEKDIPKDDMIAYDAYITAKSLWIHKTPDFKSESNIITLSQDTKVKVVDIIDGLYCKIEYHWERDGESGEYAYLSIRYLSKLPTGYITLTEEFKPENPPV